MGFYVHLVCMSDTVRIYRIATERNQAGNVSNIASTPTNCKLRFVFCNISMDNFSRKLPHSYLPIIKCQESVGTSFLQNMLCINVLNKGYYKEFVTQ